MNAPFRPVAVVAESSAAPVAYDPNWPLPFEGWPDEPPKKPAPPLGTFFDPDIDFSDEAGDQLTAEVLGLIPKQTGPGRRPNPQHQEAVVRLVLANGLRCAFHRDNPLVAHFRRDAAYEKDGPHCLTGRSLGLAIEALEALGLLTCNKGRRHRASTYEITDKLLDIALDCGVTERSMIARVPPAMLVRRYGPKPKRKPWESKPKAQLLPLVFNAQTKRWIVELETINAFIAKHDIALPLSLDDEQKWAAHLNNDDDRSGASYCKPELIQTDVYRVFNNGSFDQGGRMYGGWWISAPKTLRPRITINGQPTVELDYGGCHIHMLYHERGLECDGEPYELPAITEYEAEQGLPPETYRPCIKQYTQALINCRRGGHPHRIELKEDTVFPERFKPIEIIGMIEQKHKPINSAFRMNVGLRLQRIDSDMAVEVVTKAMNEGWLALPVHDSFIATEEKTERLRILMTEAYVRRFGLAIGITAKK